MNENGPFSPGTLLFPVSSHVLVRIDDNAQSPDLSDPSRLQRFLPRQIWDRCSRTFSHAWEQKTTGGSWFLTRTAVCDEKNKVYESCAFADPAMPIPSFDGKERALLEFNSIPLSPSQP